MIIDKNGSVFETTCRYIAHQVNCKGVMGGGVALQIAQKYPEVLSEYQSFCKQQTGDKLLGIAQFVPTHDGKTIVNLFGQNSYGSQFLHPKRFTDYQALRSSLLSTVEIIQNIVIRKTQPIYIAIPKYIGCGRGGGSWTEVLKIINDIFGGQDMINCEIWEI